MKKNLQFKTISLLLVLILGTGFSKLYSQVTVAGCTGAGNGTYTTLSAAAAAITSNQTGAIISISITGNTTEPASGIQFVAGTWAKLTISPSGGDFAISGAATAGTAILRFNGSDNITIDGLNSSGNALSIVNTTISATSGTSTIRFINGATNNMIKRCKIQGACNMAPGTNGGVIYFATDGTTINGNDNNTIDNCDIGSSGSNLPSMCIVGNGSQTTTAIGNSNITISNNLIHDYFNASGASAGLYINGGCNNWIINNNRFYQTGTRTWTAGARHYAIHLNSTSTTFGVRGFEITNNIIGYASSSQTGTYTLTGSSGSFTAINFNGVTGGAISTIDNNTIDGISLTGVTSSGTGTSAPFYLVNLVNGNLSITNNTFGTQTSTGSIVYTNNTTSSSDIYGIYAGTANDWTFNNNKIGSISVNNTNTGALSLILTYSNASAKSWICTNNTLGGTVNNSIQNNGTSNANRIVGILNNSSIGTITDNIVQNFAISSGTGTAANASIIGISNVSTELQSIQRNTVHSLRNNNTGSTVVVVAGIRSTANGTTTGTLINRNFVHSLSAATSVASTIAGIIHVSNIANYYNNMIRLGIWSDGTSITGGHNFYGIWIGGGSATGVNYNYNTVYIGGVGITGSGISASLYNPLHTSTRNIRNNIFFNARSNGSGTGSHYAIYENTTTGLTINANDYYVSGTGGVIGYLTSNRATLANWQSATSQDVNSINSDPLLVTPNAGTPDLHVSSGTPVDGAGAAIVLTTDFDGDNRASLTPYDIGADAHDAPCSAVNGGTATGNATYCISGTPSITATGYSGGGTVQYQWMSSTNSSDYPNGGGAISGQTNPASLSLGSISTTTYYWLKVTCVAASLVATSNMITATVFQLNAGADFSTCQNSGAINIGSDAIGTNYGNLTWTSNGTGTFSNANSVALATYTPSTSDINIGSVTLTLTGSATSPCPLASDTKVLTINQAPPSTTPVSICEGASSLSLTASSTCKTSVSVLSGEITSSSPTAYRPVAGSNTTVCGFQQTTSDIRPYHITYFQVTVSGNYVFSMAENPNYDGMAYITRDTLGTTFAAGLCPTDPGGGGKVIRFGDDKNIYSITGNEPMMGWDGINPSSAPGAGYMYLIAGVDYKMFTTFYDNPTLPQSFTWTLTGPSTGGQVINTSPENTTIYWYDAAVGGNLVGAGSSFNPVPSQLVNTNTPGTTTYYASCSNNTTCRTAANFTINPKSNSNTAITACNSYVWNGSTYTSSGNYTWSGTNSNGCDSSAVLNLTITSGSTIPTTIGTYTQTIAHADGATHSYVTSGCDLIATIQDAAGGNTLGSTLAEVNVNSTVDLTTTAGRMYVRRDYEITANSNGPSTITLYFTQADFDDFNNYNASNMSNYYLPLPTSGSNSDPNIPYFRIMQVIGSTISGTLQPLTWNSTENRWETTFPMTNTNARYFVYTMPSCIGVVVNNFAVAAVNGTSANATWNAVTAPASGWYSIQMENVSDNPGVWVNLGTSSNATTSRTITGLIPCKTYNFQIRRHCSSQSEGPWSSSVTITTPCNCGTPTGLAASNISNGGATVSWTSVSGAASYTIQYKPTSSSSWSAVTAPGTSTSTNLVGLASNTTYDVQIRTICTGNGSQSPWSSTVNFTTTNVCMPPAPTVSFVNYDNVGVSWPVVSGCTWYRVRYREAGTTTWSPISTVSNVASPLFIFKNLTTGVTYETQYATVCGLPNVSAWSATLNITPQIQCPTPTNLTDSAISSTKVKLKWDAGTPTPSWYNIRYRVLGSTAWIIVTSTPNSTILNNLTAGTTYEYQVLSKCASQTTSNAINTSPWSSMATFSTGTSLKPLDLDEENSDYIKVFPNPFNAILNLEYNCAKSKMLSIHIVDITGKTIVEKLENLEEGINKIEFSTESLSHGVYFLHVYDNSKMTFNAKIVK